MWTSDKVELLEKLWAEGLSASEIGTELDMTRNAVISKVHRLGLPGRPRPIRTVRPAEAPKKPAPSAKKRAPKKSKAKNPAPPHLSPEGEYVELTIPLTQRKTLVELTEEMCHWPVGEPGSANFYYCGGQALHKSPYCEHHAGALRRSTVGQRRQRHA